MIVLYRIQHSPLVDGVHTLAFLCMHDEGSAFGLSLVQTCKEGVPGVAFGVQPYCGSTIAISDPVCQMHFSELVVNVTFHPTTALSFLKLAIVEGLLHVKNVEVRVSVH
ncbi:uncharacterized protein TNCV_4070421 [Trichonephila clavipes]|nr:uncharacterized protein TNCV_4070421 [Trichonephila clavipes]